MNDEDVFFGGGEYTAEKHGSLAEYFETHDGLSCCPLFKGAEIYNELWDEGWLWPNFSYVRVMWNVARDDGHYNILSKDELEGIQANAHAGDSGIHSPIEILTQGPLWEVGKPGFYWTPKEERLA